MDVVSLAPAAPAVSVVVPLFNEEENVSPLVDAVRDALGQDESWELVLVDDGSRDETPARARALAAGDARIVLVELARNYGQTQAMQAGFDHARGHVVVSMDGDLQNDPGDIPQLVAKLAEGYDLVTGYRQRRQDQLLTRKVPSWVANRLIALLTGVRVRDNGCSLKAYRRSLLDELTLYSDLHRFLPALAVATADARITEIPVRHHPRRFGTSKYGLSRIAKLLADLVTIKMISSFRERPLALFALFALAPLGFALATAVTWALRTYAGWNGYDERVVLPGVAMMLMALSAYLLMLGLLAEVALAKSRLASAHSDSSFDVEVEA
ncbi:MAG: glycosyltransferase family 2 protein [Gemmatimonadaceae bacterium]